MNLISAYLAYLFRFELNPCSNNRTTGPIAVTRTTANSCPDTCPLKRYGGCYAKSGPPRKHWDAVWEKGVNFFRFIKSLKALPNGSLIRFNEAGDLPGNEKSGRLFKSLCIPMAKSVTHLVSWTYTHYRPTKHNIPILKKMNEFMTVNLSANDMATADKYKELGFDVCLSVPKDFQMIGSYSPLGVQLVGCPEKMGKTENCKTCGNGSPLCERSNRNYMILFPAHKAVNMVAAIFNGIKVNPKY